MKSIDFLRTAGFVLALISGMPLVHGQASLLFDGDFESGTFQGWAPGGENGGFASIAARGSCYSANDTSAISFDGNLSSNYAALLRSNPQGDPKSVARLRSQPFSAGNGIIFSALSETLDPDPGHHPVELSVNIIDSSGSTVAELPLRTAVIQLTQGCPSEGRDGAFSKHFIDTHHFAGQEISIEFTQHTRHDGFGYFTLIDNVLYIDQGQFVLNSGQPIAVAGTGVTSSGTFYLDPRATVDPDDGPLALDYRWFVDSEDSTRDVDMPCVNLNEDFRLSAGNNKATLYATDGFHYSADSIRFVIPEEDGTGDGGNGNGNGNANNDDENINDNNEDNGDDGDGNGNGNGNSTLTDPLEECDVDVSEVVVIDGGNGNTDPDDENGPAITVEPSIVNFVIGGAPVAVADNVTITADSVVSVTVSIQNESDGDSLQVESTAEVDATGSGSTSITLTQADENDPASTNDFAAAVESIEFDYEVPAGEDAVTFNRTISYVVNDGENSSDPATNEVDISE
jgi:hypothetical protein